METYQNYQGWTLTKETNEIVGPSEALKMRRQVVAIMRADNVDPKVYRTLALQADGFGATMDETLLFDWSHVRDSSPQAIQRMWFKAKELGLVTG